MKYPLPFLFAIIAVFSSVFLGLYMLFSVQSRPISATIILGSTHLILLLIVCFTLLKYQRRISSLSDSVDDLIPAIERIPFGSYDQRVISDHHDLVRLEESINAMAYEISQNIEKLDQENTTLDMLMDSMADGVIVLDGDGLVTLFNDSAKDMFNVVDVRPLGSRIAELIRDFEIIELVSRSIDNNERYQSEVELVDNRRYLSVTVTPLGQEIPYGTLVTVHELTDIKQTETSRKQFVSNVSHELRSPIASVKAMVEVLKDGAINDNEVAHDFLQRINRDIQRMTVLVDDLLELSRIESGQESFKIETWELSPIVAESISLVMDQNRMEISSELKIIDQTTNENVLVEKDRLIQILVNLLQNAVKFSRTEGEIKVSSKMTDEFVEIRVSDSGSGISEEHLPYVFERFYKVDRARSDMGTGLGLAIVKHLVQAHGGDVGVNSTEGEGSEFYFTLPVSNVAAIN
tara:strand:+ start:4006 stop:5391 length:1386 start_codon:yes stop_codon:yes gene_type:complete